MGRKPESVHIPGARRCRRRGQASVEFALTMVLMLGFVLFFVQLCLVFAWGNYVHYATFMSARAFLSAGPSMDDQQERAKEVVILLLKRGQTRANVDKYPPIAKAVGGSDPTGLELVKSEEDRDSSWMNGVRYTFKSKLFILPMGGTAGDANSVTLISESMLGREPTHEECQTEMGTFPGIWDNGC